MTRYWLRLHAILLATTSLSAYASYEELKEEDRKEVKAYFEQHKPQIKSLVDDVMISCDADSERGVKEAKKLDDRHFYENILSPILGHHKLFERPVATSLCIYPFLQEVASQMGPYTVAEPPIPFHYDRKQSLAWIRTKQGPFRRAYERSLPIYHHFKASSDRYLQPPKQVSATPPKEACKASKPPSQPYVHRVYGVGLLALITAFLMSDWQAVQKMQATDEQEEICVKEEEKAPSHA